MDPPLAQQARCAGAPLVMSDKSERVRCEGTAASSPTLQPFDSANAPRLEHGSCAISQGRRSSASIPRSASTHGRTQCTPHRPFRTPGQPGHRPTAASSSRLAEMSQCQAKPKAMWRVGNSVPQRWKQDHSACTGTGKCKAGWPCWSSGARGLGADDRASLLVAD